MKTNTATLQPKLRPTSSCTCKIAHRAEAWIAEILEVTSNPAHMTRNICCHANFVNMWEVSIPNDSALYRSLPIPSITCLTDWSVGVWQIMIMMWDCETTKETDCKQHTSNQFHWNHSTIYFLDMPSLTSYSQYHTSHPFTHVNAKFKEENPTWTAPTSSQSSPLNIDWLLKSKSLTNVVIAETWPSLPMWWRTALPQHNTTVNKLLSEKYLYKLIYKW